MIDILQLLRLQIAAQQLQLFQQWTSVGQIGEGKRHPLLKQIAQLKQPLKLRNKRQPISLRDGCKKLVAPHRREAEPGGVVGDFVEFELFEGGGVHGGISDERMLAVF